MTEPKMTGFIDEACSNACSQQTSLPPISPFPGTSTTRKTSTPTPVPPSTRAVTGLVQACPLYHIPNPTSLTVLYGTCTALGEKKMYQSVIFLKTNKQGRAHTLSGRVGQSKERWYYLHPSGALAGGWAWGTQQQFPPLPPTLCLTQTLHSVPRGHKKIFNI
jgi:hypothetical protein